MKKGHRCKYSYAKI